MKNIRIPFNLSEYKKGGYEVETRDGRSARIVCTDCMSSYPIIALVKEDITCEDEHSYHSNGTFIENYNSSYDLFLVKQEFEDGDILSVSDDVYKYILFFKSNYYGNTIKFHVLISVEKDGSFSNLLFNNFFSSNNFKIASNDDVDIIISALKKDGKCWNIEKKCIEDIKPECTLKPFDKVLVRDNNSAEWRNDFFGYYSEQSYYKYICVGGSIKQCIPYNDETKHLLGTSDDCPDKYKTW